MQLHTLFFKEKFFICLSFIIFFTTLTSNNEKHLKIVLLKSEQERLQEILQTVTALERLAELCKPIEHNTNIFFTGQRPPSLPLSPLFSFEKTPWSISKTDRTNLSNYNY